MIRTAADADGGAAAVPGDVGDVAVVGVVVVHVVTVQGDDEAVLGSFSSCFEKVAHGQVTANFIFFTPPLLLSSPKKNVKGTPPKIIRVFPKSGQKVLYCI